MKLKWKKETDLPEWVLILRFVLLMTVCTLLGVLTGRLLAHVDVARLSSDSQAWIDFGAALTPVLFIGVNLILCLAAFFLYRDCKRQWEKWDGLEEEKLDQIDHKLSYPALLGNITFILNMALFALGTYLTEHCSLPSGTVTLCIIMIQITFFGGLIWIILIQNASVKLCRKINPEKKGSTFQIHFRKTWEESCDEAQKMMIYRSAYTAFHLTNGCCMILWIIAFIGMLVFDTGVFAVILICIVNLVLHLSYTLTAMKLEHPEMYRHGR